MAEASPKVSNSAEKLALAREKAASSDFESAHLLYEEIIDADAANLDALTENGLLYMKHKGFEPAMSWIETARAINDSENLRLAAAECFLELGLTVDTVEVLSSVLEKSPLLVKARILTGLALAQLEEADDALLHAQVVLQIEPDNATARAIKAISMCQLGLHKDAITLWKNGTDDGGITDDFSNFLFAQALYGQNCLDECLLQVDRLLKHNSNHIEGLMLKSNALEDMGRMDESDLVLELVSRLTENMPDA